MVKYSFQTNSQQSDLSVSVRLENSQKQPSHSVWVFPGQGSQILGMGLELLENPFAQERFKTAQQILGWSVSDVCQDLELLNQTLYAQPSLYLFMTTLVDLFKQQGEQFYLTAGHSLGEYISLYAAGVYDFETGLYLVQHRARIMDAGPSGSMVCLIGARYEQIQAALETIPNVWQANDSQTNVLISGLSDALNTFLARVTTVKQVIRLGVSCPFHTPLMNDVSNAFETILMKTHFRDPQIPILICPEEIPTRQSSLLKTHLLEQITRPVKWQAITNVLPKYGVKKIIEIGPNCSLVKQMRRNLPDLDYQTISGLSDLLLSANCA